MLSRPETDRPVHPSRDLQAPSTDAGTEAQKGMKKLCKSEAITKVLGRRKGTCLCIQRIALECVLKGFMAKGLPPSRGGFPSPKELGLWGGRGEGFWSWLTPCEWWLH